MSQIQFSVLLAFGLIGVTVLGFLSAGSTRAPNDVAIESSADVVELRQEVGALREEIRALSEGVRQLTVTQSSLPDRVPPVSLAGAGGEDGAPTPAVSQAEFKNYVAAVLETERELRDEEREQQREAARVRMEERRREQEALQQGPYDRYNVRVNSLGNILGLNDVQKQRYHELASAYRTKLEEDMKALREKLQTERQSGGEATGEDAEDGRRRRGGGFGFGREEYRELATTLQQQFEGEMGRLLSSDQYAIYSELSSDDRGFSGRDEVRAPGDGGPETRGFGAFGGGPGGFGGRGGGRGGRGGR